MDDATHGTILTDSLKRLELKEAVPTSLGDGEHIHNSLPSTPGHHPRSPLVHEGYGFRPASGVSTPISPGTNAPAGSSSPLPDPNGLGWPGEHDLPPCIAYS